MAVVRALSTATIRRGGKDEYSSPILSKGSQDAPNFNAHILQSKSDEEEQKSINSTDINNHLPASPTSSNSNEIKNNSLISKTGLYVLVLLAFQNCFKNLLMRSVMKDKPNFLLSTAVIVVELLKLSFSASYIVFYQKQSLSSIYRFVFKDERKNTIIVAIPAVCYIMQMSLEYVAFANIDAATFAVVVQLKMLVTAVFLRFVLSKRLMQKQLLSLVILTVGVMLCNMNHGGHQDLHADMNGGKLIGLLATLG